MAQHNTQIMHLYEKQVSWAHSSVCLLWCNLAMHKAFEIFLIKQCKKTLQENQQTVQCRIIISENRSYLVSQKTF